MDAAQPPAPATTPRYPWERVTVVQLPTATVRIRPIRPSDGPSLQAGVRMLSERTRWLRFHMPITQLTDAQVRVLVEVDHHDREALVAEVRRDGGEWRPVGVARYARIGPDRADLAVVVTDAWQGRGIGRLLVDQLAAAARAEGMAAFVAQVLSENRRVLELIHRPPMGLVEVSMDGPVTDVVWWLAGPSPGTGAPTPSGDRVASLPGPGRGMLGGPS
jgi:GNAT superfamily N-acetyltransferase